MAIEINYQLAQGPAKLMAQMASEINGTVSPNWVAQWGVKYPLIK